MWSRERGSEFQGGERRRREREQTKEVERESFPAFPARPSLDRSPSLSLSRKNTPSALLPSALFDPPPQPHGRRVKSSQNALRPRDNSASRGAWGALRRSRFHLFEKVFFSFFSSFCFSNDEKKRMPSRGHRERPFSAFPRARAQQEQEEAPMKPAELSRKG